MMPIIAKCHFSRREAFQNCGPREFFFSRMEWGEIAGLKESHPYYDQVQGQMFVTKGACAVLLCTHSQT